MPTKVSNYHDRLAVALQPQFIKQLQLTSAQPNSFAERFLKIAYAYHGHYLEQKIDHSINPNRPFDIDDLVQSFQNKIQNFAQQFKVALFTDQLDHYAVISDDISYELSALFNQLCRRFEQIDSEEINHWTLTMMQLMTHQPLNQFYMTDERINWYQRFEDDVKRWQRRVLQQLQRSNSNANSD